MDIHTHALAQRALELRDFENARNSNHEQQMHQTSREALRKKRCVGFAHGAASGRALHMFVTPHWTDEEERLSSKSRYEMLLRQALFTKKIKI